MDTDGTRNATPLPASGPSCPAIRSGPRHGRHRVQLAQLVFAAALAVIVGCVLYQTFHRDLNFDDAYAFLRYADNLLGTGQYGWNAGERTFGCTSIPYVLFVALLKLARLDRAFTGGQLLRLAALSWGVMAFWLLHQVVRIVTRGTPLEHSTVRRGLLVSLAATPILFRNVLTGMDTMMSLCATVLIVHQYLRYRERPTMTRLLAAAASAYAAYLVRPDNGLYTLTFPVLFLWNARQPRMRIIVSAACIIALLVADTVIKARYFGSPLPLPYFAKSAGFYEAYIGLSQWNVVTFTANFLLAFGGVLLILTLLFATPESVLSGSIYLLPLLLTITYYSTVTQVMGQSSRYYVPSLPFLVTGLLVMLGRGLAASTVFQARRVAYALAAVSIFLFTQDVVANAYSVIRAGREQARANALERVEGPIPPVEHAPGDFWWSGVKAMSDIAHRLPPGTTIAAAEHGYLGAENPRIRIVDLTGLHNRDLAQHGWSDDLLSRLAPEMIWMPPQDYVGLYLSISHGARFREAYDFYPTLNYGLAIRKGSSQLEMVRQVLGNYGFTLAEPRGAGPRLVPGTK
jgi:hypothetical protein